MEKEQLQISKEEQKISIADAINQKVANRQKEIDEVVEVVSQQLRGALDLLGDKFPQASEILKKETGIKERNAKENMKLKIRDEEGKKVFEERKLPLPIELPSSSYPSLEWSLEIDGRTLVGKAHEDDDGDLVYTVETGEKYVFADAKGFNDVNDFGEIVYAPWRYPDKYEVFVNSMRQAAQNLKLKNESYSK